MKNAIQELIVDAYGCKADLSDLKTLEKASRIAVTSVGAQIVTGCHHIFQPHGLTLCLILKESHFVLSTWPEHELAILNIFLCNEKMDTKQVWAQMKRVLRPTHEVFHPVVHEIRRRKEAA